MEKHCTWDNWSVWHKDWPLKIYVDQWPIFHGPLILPFYHCHRLKLFVYISKWRWPGVFVPLQALALVIYYMRLLLHDIVNVSLQLYRGYWVFQCKIEFYFTEWIPQAVFSRVAAATSENTDCVVHEWNKIQSYTEKIKFSVSFMLLFTIFMFLPTCQPSRQKTYFFPSHFASILSCSVCLVGIIWGKNTVLYLENEPKYH